MTSPNDGFSVIIATYNMQPYLKHAIEGFVINSSLDNEIIVCDDGSTDGTKKYLDSRITLKKVHQEHRGPAAAWNQAGKLATKEWVFIGQDDMYPLPNWDRNLAAWLESTDAYISPQFIEPFQGSYLQFNAGNGPEDFNEDALVEFVAKLSRHELKPQKFQMPAFKRTVLEELGWLDERYVTNVAELEDFYINVSRKFRKPWLIAQDSFIYHTHPQNRLFPPKDGYEGAEHDFQLFQEKWGVPVSGAREKLIP